MIIDIIRILATIFLTQVNMGFLRAAVLNSVKSIEIWPNLTNFTLISNTPEERSTLLCTGNLPIHWYFRKYNGTLPIKKKSSIEVFPEDNNRSTYISMLSLRKATYLDTGNYICAPSEELRYFKEIYIFVSHETHLLAIPEDFKLRYDISKDDKVIGSFRPTSHDVNVTIISTEKSNGTCLTNVFFKCNDGKCIRKDNICDGIRDCTDNSDEDEQMCKKRTCPTNRPFKCDNGQCISDILVCRSDRMYGCKDHSDEDEQMCKNRTCPSDYSFKCSNGQCTFMGSVCDGYEDCTDNSDEDVQMCKNRTCPTNLSFRCGNGQCINDDYVCDAIKNCIDNSDEDEQMCKNWSCPGRPFRCGSGQCFEETYVCDGFGNCSDNSDEDEQMCKNRTCPTDIPFKCSSGKCINELDMCNGGKDCSDGSDEDEEMCKEKKCPTNKTFKCGNGRCIYDTNVCDTNKDCIDNSDEDEEMCKNMACPTKSFRCASGKCIHNSLICDGLNQCKDNSDEDEQLCERLFLTPRTKFDEKKGFEMDVSIFFFDYNIACIASKNHITDIRKIPNPLENWLHIEDSSSNHVFLGQNLTLNCSLEHKIDLVYLLKWIVPHSLENKTQHIKKGNYTDRNILLKIQNVSSKDEGIYNCIAMMTNGRNFTKTYKLNAHAHDVNYLNLKNKDGINKKIRPAGHTSVQWIMKILSNQNTSLEWVGPNGKLLKVKSKNECVKNNNCSSEIVLTNLQLSHSGIYKLATNNENISKEIEVILFVEEKPKVIFVKSLHLGRPYYEIGKSYDFEFYISGYPLPDITWTFKKCSKYPKCGESHGDTNEIKKEEIQVSSTTVKLIITINITDTGIIICNATNILGNYTKQYTVLAIDTSNDLEVKGLSSDNIIAGDNITILCGASVYNYINNIQWIFPNCTKTQKNINITNIKTKYSFQSKLMITNISRNFNGYFNCIMKKIHTNDILPETEIKSTTVKVEDPRYPVINNSNKTSQKMVTYHGNRLNLTCSAIGTPHPTISWFQGDQPMLFDKNDSRVSLKNENQTLVILFNETENKRNYTCNASNKFGSVVLTYTLEPTLNTVNDDQKFGIFPFCIMLILILGMIIAIYATIFKREKTKKKTKALIKKYKLEKGADESENPILWLEVQEYIKIYKRWNIPEDKLKLGKLLGSGAFGVVFKAKAIDLIDENTSTDVAVKTVYQNTNSDCLKALEDELKIMIEIGYHINVVNLLGVCIGNIDKILMVVVEYCRYGSVNQYLLKNRNNFINQFTIEGEFIDQVCESKSKNSAYKNVPNDITKSKNGENTDSRISADGTLVNNEVNPEEHTNDLAHNENQNVKSLCTLDLIQWSFQIARGMDYLASKNIIHGDLATRNILLAEENIVKICDFGLSRTMHNCEIYTKKSKKNRLPIKWLAIESIRDLVFSTKSDVWSYGIVLWEIFTLGATPYPSIQFYDLLKILLEDYRLEQPIYANSKLYNIMLDCWKTEPKERPSFVDLFERLGDLLQGYSTKSPYVNFNVETINETTKSSDSKNDMTSLAF